MIVIIVSLILFFALGSVSPLLVSDDTEHIVELESDVTFASSGHPGCNADKLVMPQD